MWKYQQSASYRYFAFNLWGLIYIKQEDINIEICGFFLHESSLTIYSDSNCVVLREYLERIKNTDIILPVDVE